MILSMENQAVIFLTTVVAGFVIGFTYDLFRIFRKIIPHPNFLTQIEDIIFWISVSLGMFLIMFTRNYGEIRAFNILGSFIGCVLYFSTLSIFFMAASTAIINLIKKILLFIFKAIATPFKILLRFLKIPYRFCIKFLKKRIYSIKKLLQKTKNYVKIKRKEMKRDIKIIADKT